MKHFAQANPSISIPHFSQQPLGDGSTPSQGSDPSGKNKQIAQDAIPATSEGETIVEVCLPLIPLTPLYTVSQPPSPSNESTSPTKFPSSNKSLHSPSLSESYPPKDFSSPPKEPSVREPFSDDCQFLYTSDSESEEEGLTPRRVIREPEEEQRMHYIRHFEAARVKIPLRTSEPEIECPVPISVYDEFDFLTKEQRAEALEEQRKRDEMNESLRLAQRLQKKEYARKWVQESNEEQSEKLAEELAQGELQQDNLKVDPRIAQEKILQALMKEQQGPEDDEIEWCKKRFNHRISEARITNISIQGITFNKGKSLKVYTTISRGGLKEQKDGAQFLKFYGFTEWLEIREALQRSRSKFKGLVEEIIDQLLQRMSKFVDIPPLPEKTKKRKAKSDDVEEGPSFRNEHETKFSIDEVLAHLKLPDISMLDTSFPEARPYAEREVVSSPIAGMVFLDNDGFLRFFRNSEVKKAPSKLIKMMYYSCWTDNDPIKLQEYVYEKELRRRQEKF